MRRFLLVLFISCFISQTECAGMWERISSGITEFVRGSKNRRDTTVPYYNPGSNYYNYNRYYNNRNDMYELQGDRFGLENGSQYSPAMSALSLLGFLFFLNLISQTMMMPMMGGGGGMMGRRKRHVNAINYTSEQVNACIQRFMCEANEYDANGDKYSNLKRVLTQLASVGFSYAIRGTNRTELLSDLSAIQWGISGKKCNFIAEEECPDSIFL